MKKARKISPKKSETPELKRVFKRLKNKSQNGEKELKMENIMCRMAKKNSLEPSSKLMDKSGIQGKIEAYEHLGDINAKKLEFDVSGPSGPKTVGARGGIRTPNRRRPKFTPQKNTLENYWGPERKN